MKALTVCCAVLAPTGACARRAPTRPPASWTEAAPGLDVARLALPESREAWAIRYDPNGYQLALQWSSTGLRIPGSLPQQYVAAVNGGYFERDLRPSGLLIADGREVQAESGHHGALVINEGRAQLDRFHEIAWSPSVSALQAWPFLIEPGGADGIHGDDGKLSRRTAFGLDSLGRGLLIAVPTEGVSLYQLMDICRRFGAVAAVNLDGGPSTGFALGVPPGWTAATATDVSNLLVLSRRSAARTGTQAAGGAAPSPRSTATHAL